MFSAFQTFARMGAGAAKPNLGPELVITPYSGTAAGGWGFSGNTITRDGVTSGGSMTLTITGHDNLLTYAISFDVADWSGDSFSMVGSSGNVGEINSNGHKSFEFTTIDASSIKFIAWYGSPGTLTISNISVRLIL